MKKKENVISLVCIKQVIILIVKTKKHQGYKIIYVYI